MSDKEQAAPRRLKALFTGWVVAEGRSAASLRPCGRLPALAPCLRFGRQLLLTRAAGGAARQHGHCSDRYIATFGAAPAVLSSARLQIVRAFARPAPPSTAAARAYHAAASPLTWPLLPFMPWDVAGRLRGLLACSSGYVQITLLSALNMAGNQLPKLMGAFLMQCSSLCCVKLPATCLKGKQDDSGWGIVPTLLVHGVFCRTAADARPALLPSCHAAALFLAKVVRSSSFLARADASFDCYFDPPPRATPVPVGRLRAAARTAASAARSAARFAWLALLFAPVLLSAPLVLRTGWRRAEWLALLTSTLEAAGPAFQKYAQWAATRRDLFAPDVCAALAKLQTQVRLGQS